MMTMTDAERIADLERQLRETREVLRDLAHERGLPDWLAEVVEEREALVVALTLGLTNAGEGWRPCCRSADDEPSDIDCKASRFLRLLDPGETQRQVDDAYEWVLEQQAQFDERLNLSGDEVTPDSLPVSISHDIGELGQGYVLDPATGLRLCAVVDIRAGMLVARGLNGIEPAGSRHPVGVAIQSAARGEPVIVAATGAYRVPVGFSTAAERFAAVIAADEDPDE